MKPLQQYFHMVLFIKYVLPTFESVDDTVVLPFKWNLFGFTFTWYYLFLICSFDFWICGWILLWDHSNETSSAVLSRGTINLVCSSRGLFLSANPKTDFWSRRDFPDFAVERNMKSEIANACNMQSMSWLPLQKWRVLHWFTNYAIIPCRILWSAVRIATMEHKQIMKVAR